MEEAPPPAAERVSYGGAPNQFVEFRYPTNGTSAPLVVFIHGGFWRAKFGLAYAGHICQALTAAGWITANLEYRRAGQDGGGWPGTFHDIRCALAVARGDRPHTACVVLGHSAGGQLALRIAGEATGLSGVIGLAAVSNPRRAWELGLGSGAAAEFFGGTPQELPGAYSMPEPLCPAVLIHGTADDIVPVEMSREFAGAEVLEIAGADHFDVVDPLTEPFKLVVASLERFRPIPHRTR
jgi:acetyl esterase/lipase